MPRGVLGRSLLAVVGTLATLPSLVRAESPLYLVDSTFSDQRTRIFRIDPATAAMELQGDLGLDLTPVLGLAAADARILYLTGTDRGPTARCAGNVACLLVRVELDPASPLPSSVRIIGPVLDAGTVVNGITALTFRGDGRLYAVSQDTDRMYVVDPATALATPLVDLDLDLHGGDITFDGEDRLWLWSNLGNGSGLYRVDPETGRATAFDLHPFLDLSGLSAVGHTDVMRGVSQSVDRLFAVDPVVGVSGVGMRITLEGAGFDHSRGDLDSPFCGEDAGCGDDSVCTEDRCTPGGCRHPAVPGCCESDADCATDLCTEGWCEENRCRFAPTRVDDGDACTRDSCDPATGVLHLPAAGEDHDQDRIPDCADACPGTPAHVPVGEDGCELLAACPCEGPGRPWRNHGEYVTCVRRNLSGVLPPNRREDRRRPEILKGAARSSCGMAPGAGSRAPLHPSRNSGPGRPH